MKLAAPALTAIALLGTALYAAPVAAAQPAPCRPGFVLSGLLCTPDPNAAPPAQAQPAPAAPAPAPAPHRSVIDRILGRNKPAPATPAPAPAPPPRPTAPAPATPAPAPPVPPAPPAGQTPPVVPVVILPPPTAPVPGPSERTVWLHTCVDLYAAQLHLVQLDNQILDVPPLALVLFQCSANPIVLEPVPTVPVVPGQPPAAANQMQHFGPITTGPIVTG